MFFKYVSPYLTVFLLATACAVAADRPEYVEGQVLIKFKNRPGMQIQSMEDTVQEISSKHRVQIKQDLSLHASPGAGTLKLVEDKSRKTSEIIAALKSHPDIEYVEPNYYFYFTSTPNDPHFEKLWGLQNLGQTVNSEAGTEGVDVDFLDAIKIEQAESSEALVIGVADSGIDPNHPDLRNQLWVNPLEIAGNDTDDDGNGYKDDIHGYDFVRDTGILSDSGDHGTHVAGTIAAQGNNNLGIIGAYPRAKLLGLKLSNDGDGVSTSASISAFNYAVKLKEAGVNIVAINASFGGPNSSASQKEAIKNLGDAGIILCAAAGNDSKNIDESPAYPACYDLQNIISVGNTDSNNELNVLSNYGVKSTDLAAPGTNIYSTISLNKTPKDTTFDYEQTRYDATNIFGSGTTNNDGISGDLVDCKKGESGDFPASLSGNIALIERTSFEFELSTKTKRATEAGAVGVIYYNDSNSTDSIGFLIAIEAPPPVIIISRANALTIKANPGKTATIRNFASYDDAYGFKNGTSMAAPHVSAAVGHAAHNYPDETVEQRIKRILDNVIKDSKLDGKVATGGLLNIKNLIDTDSDSLPDWWEMQHFASLSHDSTSDFDNDSVSNLNEFWGLTDPKSSKSQLAFHKYTIDPNEERTLTFLTQKARLYQIQVSNDIASGNWQSLGPSIKGDGTNKTVKDNAIISEHPMRFYRIHVQPAN